MIALHRPEDLNTSLFAAICPSGPQAWDYHSARHITYFGIFENVLNQRYMEALGFPALRASYRAGARLTL